MSKNRYPLAQLITIKERRLEAAERLLKAKKEILKTEKEKEQELEKERNTTKKHYQEKINQLREELDKGTTSDKIDIMKKYIKVVHAELDQKEATLKEQVQVVKAATEHVEIARKDMVKKQHDVEKLKMHHSEWTLQEKKEEAYREGIDNDDLGTSIHSNKKQ